MGSYSLSLLVVVGCVVCFCGYHQGNQLPLPETIHASPVKFSEARALQHLSQLSIGIGPRPATIPDNISRVHQYIESLISDIRPLALENGWNITVQYLPVSGEYFWNNLQFIYRDLKNMLVIVEPLKYLEVDCQGALLVNAHVDTAVGSPGAGDDGLAVAIILESMRAIVSSKQHQSIPFYFLLNNGEELGLLGTHGFVLQHPKIVKNIGAFINLEAAGTKGPETLFQAGGNSFVINQYANHVQYPRGSIVAQDLFRSGIIPSYTDFQVFTKFGNLSGIDMALYRNGYVYHTPHDSLKNISPGTIQHFGSNLLSMLQKYDSSVLLKSSIECNIQKDDYPVTFFDIGGWYMIHYDHTANVAVTICLVTSVLCIIFSQNRGKVKISVLWIYVIVLACNVIVLVSGISLPLLLAYYLHASGTSMMWYSYPLGAVGMYFPLSLMGISFSSFTLSHFLFRVVTHTSLCSWNISMITWMMLVIIGCNYHIGATYLALMYGISCSLVSLVISTKSTSNWLWVVCLSSFIIPSFILSDISSQFLDTIVPISGRAGLKPVEFIISGFCGLVASLLMSPLIPLLLHMRWRKNVILQLLLVCAAVSLVSFLALPSPMYSENSPKRLLVEHVTDTMYNETYILFIPADRVPLVAQELPLQSFKQLNETYRSHGPLATIPSLKPNEGMRWELSTTSKDHHNPHITVSTHFNDTWSINVHAPSAFSIEFWISPCTHIVTVGETVSAIDILEVCVSHKVRLLDGNGMNEWSLPIQVSGTVKIETFINYIDPPNQLQEIVSNLPPHIAAVPTATHKFSNSIYFQL